MKLDFFSLPTGLQIPREDQNSAKKSHTGGRDANVPERSPASMPRSANISVESHLTELTPDIWEDAPKVVAPQPRKKDIGSISEENKRGYADVDFSGPSKSLKKAKIRHMPHLS